MLKDDGKKEYFEELTLSLRHEGLTAGPEEDGLLPVDMDGQRLCRATETGGVRYWREDVAGEARKEALDRVTDIVRATAEYMSLMRSAPQLTTDSLKGDYRRLADFNGVVLAGHPTQYGVQFVTWKQSDDWTSLHQGNYFGPSSGMDSYAAAKRDFAVRSGLIPRSALFAPEQLTEIYRSIHETLDGAYPLTDERRECLKSAAEQIEHSVPDLEERVYLSDQKELELAEMEPPKDCGMQFC